MEVKEEFKAALTSIGAKMIHITDDWERDHKMIFNFDLNGRMRQLVIYDQVPPANEASATNIIELLEKEYSIKSN
jgi:hypothetical protein